MNCPNCGKQVPESAKVCGYCGTKLETKHVRTCPDCGKDIPTKAKVCGFCGSKLAKPALKTQKVASTPTKGSPPSEQAVPTAKRKPKWGLIGAIAAILLIAAVLIWLFTMRPSRSESQPGQSAIIHSERAPFTDAVGNWEATDTDGSSMHLKISQNGENTFTVLLIDDGASLCGSDSSGSLLSFEARGVGIAKGNVLQLNNIIGKCFNSEEEFIYDETFTYNPAADTLKDMYDTETTWYRK